MASDGAGTKQIVLGGIVALLTAGTAPFYLKSCFPDNDTKAQNTTSTVPGAATGSSSVTTQDNALKSTPVVATSSSAQPGGSAPCETDRWITLPPFDGQAVGITTPCTRELLDATREAEAAEKDNAKALTEARAADAELAEAQSSGNAGQMAAAVDRVDNAERAKHLAANAVAKAVEHLRGAYAQSSH